jgi:hypothetical protein
MGLMPTRYCPKCQSNRHVTAFVSGNEWCKTCRESSTEAPAPVPRVASNDIHGKADLNSPASPTEILAELVRKQALTNPALAEKQSRLIEKLRSDLGSDQKVFDKLKELFGFMR